MRHAVALATVVQYNHFCCRCLLKCNVRKFNADPAAGRVASLCGSPISYSEWSSRGSLTQWYSRRCIQGSMRDECERDSCWWSRNGYLRAPDGHNTVLLLLINCCIGCEFRTNATAKLNYENWTTGWLFLCLCLRNLHEEVCVNFLMFDGFMAWLSMHRCVLWLTSWTVSMLICI